VAAVQGSIGGILFAIVGINAAIFWGVVMAVCSLLPVVGTALVWGPAAIGLFATGHVWEGILLIVGGTVLVGLADNVLRPILVGYDTKMPDYLVLLTTLGGLALFGLTGVILGPLVGAMFLVVWEMMAEEYADIDSPGGTAPAAADGSPPTAAVVAPAQTTKKEAPVHLVSDPESPPPSPS
jgi:predicted PurR-regulated permease PerM